MTNETNLPETLLLRIIDDWKLFPLAADDFAVQFLKKNADVKLSSRRIADALRRSLPYAVRKQTPIAKAETKTLYELSRGGLVWLDTMHLSGFKGGPWYVQVAVDSYSRSVFYQPMKRISARSAARAFETVIFRFKNGPIRRVISDRGGEVRLTP